MAKILVVDDDPAIRRAVRLLFERRGHQVGEASSAAEALALVAGNSAPDAVVCDVFMPETNGIELYQQILSAAPQLKNRVVFLTGSNRDPAVHLPIEQLGVPLLGKLDDLELVVDAVRIALLHPPVH